MKITFEFDTQSEHFDYKQLEAVKNADKLISCLSEIQNMLTGLNHHRYEYTEWYANKNKGDEVDYMVEKFHEILQNNGIVLSELE